MVLITPAPPEEPAAGEEAAKKKSSLEEVAHHLHLDRRLVEYFVVVSSIARNKGDSTTKNSADNSSIIDDELLFVDDYDFQPQITARYPLTDHPGNPLHESVTFFCHPSGGIRLRTECSMPKVHYFCATGGTGQKMYGTCLTLWEPYMITAQHADEDDSHISESKQMEVFLPKCLVLLSTHPYLTAFREFLTQLNRLSKMGEMTLPLERYVVNFCSEVPAPPPGSFEVQTTILDSVIKIWSPPHNQPIAWVSLPFGHLFECLDIDNVVLVWHCLMLERQVLLTSTQLSLLTECSEILLSLLFPMRWSHAYIPLLPHFLIPILSAPMPFFCGINKANLADALCDLSRECVVVDLDKNLVTLGPDTAALPPLPTQLKLDLVDRLESDVGMVFREARSLTKNDDYSERGIHLPNHVKLMADAMWEGRLCLFDEAFHLAFTPEESRKNILNGNDLSGMDMSERDGEAAALRILTASEKMNMRKQSQWDAVQEAFLDAYVYLLRNYRRFLVFPSKDNEGSYGGAGFRSKEFVQTQRYDMQEFLQELIGTQMFDNFVTKRLYGSGEADVTFFDRAIDQFMKTQGLLANSSFMSWRASSSKPSAAAASTKKTQGGGEPLLQSARVHRKLKTIVPPEPSGEGLPPHPLEANNNDDEDGVVVTQLTEDSLHGGDDNGSVGSGSTSGTRSTSRSLGNRSPSKKNFKSIQDKAADILEKSKYRYTYPTFPSEFDTELFGTPRPLPSAVIAEFDRQRSDAAKFRRKKGHSKGKEKGGNRSRTLSDQHEVPPTAEVSTFTLFFMAFSAVVGKELMQISDNPLLAQDKTILATYTHPSDYESSESDSDTGSVPTTEGTSTINTDGRDEEDEFEDAHDEEVIKEDPPGIGVSASASTEEAENGEEDSAGDAASKDESEQFVEAKEEEVKAKDNTSSEGKAIGSSKENEPRSRFRDPLSALQIEEAKATGRAQLALAFEMLTMMKKRGLKTDPEAYKCLIDACGRVGDTQRATELLAKMHSDGIVADGVVYSCLVAAFSVESAWKQTTDAEQEELPEWANSTAVEMDWNKLQKQSFLDTAKKQLQSLAGGGDENDDDGDDNSASGSMTRYQKLRNRLSRKKDVKRPSLPPTKMQENNQFYVTEPVEMQIELGENLLEIVYPDISVDTDNETCPRCNFLLSDDDVVAGWTPSDPNDYTTSCPNCMQRFVPHFRVQSTSPTFMGSRGPASPLMCERLSPWVLQKEIRSVMSDREGIENLLNPDWREEQNKNAVLWWNLVLSCMRYRFPFSFLLQGSFGQQLIAPMPETS